MIFQKPLIPSIGSVLSILKFKTGYRVNSLNLSEVYMNELRPL